MTVWMDLTNSMVSHTGNVVGIIRAELMLVKNLHEIDPSVRFSVLTDYGFREVKSHELKWLFASKNINDDYIKYQKKKKHLFKKIAKKLSKQFNRLRCHLRKKSIKKSDFVLYPYADNDVVFSCGWFGTKKEELFNKVTRCLPGLKLVYTIYDLVMVKENLRHIYYPRDIMFDRYMTWISRNCDAVVYGGKTAQKDAEKYFDENNLPILPGYPIKWGNDFSTSVDDSDILERLNITKPFILSVGSIDAKKNYGVLYRAYCKMKQQNIKNIPQLIIVGRVLDEEKEFKSELDSNPLIKDYIKVISCSDKDLQKLYKNCLFTVLPTLYEGWSLTLPESFYYGKLCVCSNVEPLKEVGGDFAYYVNPNHPQDWIDAITHFVNNEKSRQEYENKIHKNWKSVSWMESSKKLDDILNKIAQLKKYESVNDKPVLYYDLTLFWHNSLSGIPRTQMLLARNLNKYNKNIKYFWMNQGKYNEFTKKQLFNLLGDGDLDKSLKSDRGAINGYITKDVPPFRKQDIVFSAGVGYDNKSFDILLKLHEQIGFKYAQVLYDFTPITVPQTHPAERVRDYPKFLKNAYELSDFIFYGGATAQKDGAKFQTDNGLTIKDSAALKWGSDIVSHKYTKKQIAEVFEKYGITGDFILSVGTIEARKNYETLYRAYLELLEDKSVNKKLPQMIFCGHPGWKTETFCHLLNVDNRTRGKVIQISPTDTELDILYQNCKFTCLASFYEGWSLTLPESLNYGKFCLASDTPSLTETGQDIIDYANPYDPVEWAEKIKFYYTNARALKQREMLIKKKWHNTTWDECAKNVNKILNKITEK